MLSLLFSKISLAVVLSSVGFGLGLEQQTTQHSGPDWPAITSMVTACTGVGFGIWAGFDRRASRKARTKILIIEDGKVVDQAD